jgi:hypothetical protein
MFSYDADAKMAKLACEHSGCGKEFGSHNFMTTADGVRAHASLAGWRVVEGRDYCKDHVPGRAPGVDLHLKMALCAHVDGPGRCSATAVVAGDVRAVLLLGWGTDAAEEHLFCPAHHPQGPNQVLAQVEGTALFMRAAHACDDTGPEYRPEVLDLIQRIRRELDRPPGLPGHVRRGH